jgi:hypothetical protein
MSPGSAAANSAPARIRSPWLVFGLTVLTLGVYWFAWYYLINRELRDFGRRRGGEGLAKSDPQASLLAVTAGVLLVVPAVISLVNTTRRIRRAEELAEVKLANGWIVGGVALGSVFLLFAPLLFIPSYLQNGLNNAWARDPGAEPAPGPREWLASARARFGGGDRTTDPAEAAVHDAIADLSNVRQDFEKRVRERLRALKDAQKSGKKSIKGAEKQLSAAKDVPLIAHAGSIRIYEDRVQTPEGTHPLDDRVTFEVDTAGNMMVTRRHTLTRFALIGVFSVFTPKATKHDNRELYFLAEHPQWASIAKLNPDAGMGARQAAQAANLAARNAAAAKVQRQATIQRVTAALDDTKRAASSEENRAQHALRAEQDTYSVVLERLELVQARVSECEAPSNRVTKAVEKARRRAARAAPDSASAADSKSALSVSPEAT